MGIRFGKSLRPLAGFLSKDLHSAQAAQPSRARGLGGHCPPCHPARSRCLLISLHPFHLVPCPFPPCPASLWLFASVHLSFSLSQKCFATVPPTLSFASVCTLPPSYPSLRTTPPHSSLCFPPSPLLSLALSLLFSLPPSLSHTLGKGQSTHRGFEGPGSSRPAAAPSSNPSLHLGTPHHPAPCRWRCAPGHSWGTGGTGAAVCSCLPPPPRPASSHHSPGKAKQQLGWGVFITLGKSGSEKHWVQPLFLK